MDPRNQGIIGGAGGGGGAGAGGYAQIVRRAPAEDLVDAVNALNRAIRTAIGAGWDVSVCLGEGLPIQRAAPSLGEFPALGQPTPAVTASISRTLTP